ncbi:MAG: hypothetical protein U0793_26970 [Gemmataceae bacterium]
MRARRIPLFVIGLVLCLALNASSQDEEKKGPKKGPPDKKKGPPRFELGKVLPPFVREELDLSADQEKQIADIEKEVRAKLLKILTDDQKRKIETLKGPKAPPDGKEKGPKGAPDGKSKEFKDEAKVAPASGIQWYATWESGLKEAGRSGKPIFLVSAAPHCAGVSGTW